MISRISKLAEQQRENSLARVDTEAANRAGEEIERETKSSASPG
jgi:hypothetical protein